MFALRDKRLIGSATAFLAVATLAFALHGELEGASAAKPNKPNQGLASKPNIIVITTDDQTVAQLNESTMPTVMSQLAAQGTSFNNMIATTPLCCPSRASYLTGEYMHNNGVANNRPGYESLVRKRAVLPAWLQRAGYVTAHVGKYLNRFGHSVKPDSTPAPGWDEWVAALEPRSYFDYSLQVNGRTVKYGSDDQDYLTRVFNRKAVKMITKYTPKPQPLYLQVDQFAPHERGAGDPSQRCAGGAIPDPRTTSCSTACRCPRRRTTTRRTSPTSRASSRTCRRSARRSTTTSSASGAARWRRSPPSIAASPRSSRALTATGELDNTVIMLWSDNGFFYGEHRIPAEKTIPYEEALRVPMIWRIPSQYLGGTTQIRTADQLVGNIDIAPTILDLAGATPCIGKSGTNCRVMDGRSMLGLMTGDSTGFPPDRTLLIETGGVRLSRRPRPQRGLHPAPRRADRGHRDL